MQTVLRQILAGTLRSEEPDAELLRRFAEQRDADAFTQLVRRYGGLVWGQCRQLLANEADADDAFQATFLALARAAKSIRLAHQLGPWLHGVAYRVCQNARRQDARRTRRERATATAEATHPVADTAWDDLLAAVHEELHRLPDKLRVAFVLCHLEGKSTTEAARQLGLKLGTFSARLSRAKEQLLARLSARGLTAGAAVLATLSGSAARAGPALVHRAVELAVSASVVPAAILSLTQGVVLMGLTKAKILTVVILAGMLTLGGLWSVNAQAPVGGVPKPKLGDPTIGPPPAKEVPEIKAEIEKLRAELALREKLLQMRQAELERKAAEDLAGKVKSTEFRYIVQKPGFAPTEAGFEKLVREVEKDGYRFVGIMTLTMPETPNAPAIGPTPTMVFRKQSAKLTGAGSSEGPGGTGDLFNPKAPKP